MTAPLEVGTPRTDAAEHDANLFRPDRKVVSVEHARQLERELAALQQRCEKAEQERTRGRVAAFQLFGYEGGSTGEIIEEIGKKLSDSEAKVRDLEEAARRPVPGTFHAVDPDKGDQ